MLGAGKSSSGTPVTELHCGACVPGDNQERARNKAHGNQRLSPLREERHPAQQPV